jgi:hypothetical protein
LVISAGAGLLIFCIGLQRYLADGSLWIDEASVAYSLLELSPLEYFGPLVGNQVFPRLYLLAIRGSVEIGGHETLVLRALPFLFFAVGVFVWMRLLMARFAALPFVLLVGALLAIIPTTWVVYASMLKQYTLDTLLALLVLSIPDRALESCLSRGERRWRAALVMLPWIFSYVYVFAVFGRCAGYCLMRISERRLRLDTGALVYMAIGLALFGGVLYMTDVRHTIVAELGDFWHECTLTSNRATVAGVCDRMLFDWYQPSPYFRQVWLGDAQLWTLRMLTLLGAVSILVAVSGRQVGAAAPDAWGSRSFASIAMVVGLALGSIPISYPLCGGRLVLFVLLPMQIVLLEGVATARAWLLRLPRGEWVASGAVLALALALAPTAVLSVQGFLASSPPNDLRPALRRIRSDPSLPVIVDPCTHHMLAALPSDMEGLQVRSVGELEGSLMEPLPAGEIWLLTGVKKCWGLGRVERVLGQVAEDRQLIERYTKQVALHRGSVRQWAREDMVRERNLELRRKRSERLEAQRGGQAEVE